MEIKVRRLVFLWVVLGVLSCQKNVKREDGDSSICFSPNPDCTQMLKQFIRSAKKSVDIAIFQITEPQITQEILEASRRISVRVIADSRQSNDLHSTVKKLLNEGVSLRFGRQKGIMHHKFIIVDDEKLETGSFNFTRAAGLKNQENQIYSKDTEVVQAFVRQFKKMWNEAHAP